MTRAVGLTEAAEGLLEELWALGEGAAVADLCEARDKRTVLRALIELRRGGLIRLDTRGRGRRARAFAVLTDAGRRACE